MRSLASPTRMENLHRFLRITLFVPLALAGTLTVLAAQSTIILGALCFGIAWPAMRKPEARTYVEATPPDAAADVSRPADLESEPASEEPSGATDISFLPLRPIKPDSLILLANEECYLQEAARLIVQVAETQRLGGPGGFSIGRRVILNQMPGIGRGKRHAEPIACDGRIYVTNTRIVFVGPVTVNMHVAQILTLDPTPAGVSLTFVNEQPMEFVTGNRRLGITLRKVVYRNGESG